jgi:SAM-dependent methyltransferase
MPGSQKEDAEIRLPSTDNITIPSSRPFNLASRELYSGLRAFNRKWRQRKALFFRYHSRQPWAPGLILTPEVRAAYEPQLPIADFLSDLACLAKQLLPHPCWLPRLLRRTMTPAAGQSVLEYASLPDLWSALPPHLAGRVTFTPERLMATLCALADLPRYGTAAGRYPAQLDRIRQFAASRRHAPVRLLDLGCGVGHGTCEMAAALADMATPVTAIGLTREPLEAWMATQRQLPHDRRPRRRYPETEHDLPIAFIAAELPLVPLRQTFDLVTVNGLGGGPAFDNHTLIRNLLIEIRRCTAPGSALTFADTFHEGCRKQHSVIRAEADRLGWTTESIGGFIWCTRTNNKPARHISLPPPE